METSTFVAILHIFASIHLGVSELSITSKSSELKENLGVDLFLECEVAGQFDPFTHQIVWYKSAGDGSDVQMNTMAFLNPPFKTAERYSLTFENDLQATDPTISLPLSISGVELADNGTFTCQLMGSEGVISSVTHSVLVSAPIETLELFTNDTRKEGNETEKLIYGFEALTPTRVACKTVGGNPKPTLRMHRGDFEVTTEFTETVKEVVTGEKGLEATVYEVELATDEFRAERADDGEMLKCIARIHKMHESKRQLGGKMEVVYAPFFHCESNAYAFPGTENFTMDCKVSANPKIEMDSIFWIIGNSNGTNITTDGSANSTRPGFVVNITADPNDDSAIHISLTLSLINDTSYQGYTLRVKNPIGEKHHQILLAQATTTQSTTTTKKPKTPPKKNNDKDSKPNPGAVGGHDTDTDSAGVHGPFSLLVLILITGALSW